ncbi:MAG TPA: ABC transporter permease, partial [Tepidisphaeraceae bacterium]
MQLFGPIAAAIPDHAEWYVAGLIVVIGLFVIGIQDLVRFSWRRAWAISSVSFAESLRRRVLWITPLAILGVILVSQLQKPLDEQDAIRQTTKFCLFATGLLVVVVAIILACTNLPKEIESRVIFTIVTKPTTRLELVLGKVIGFARVSAAILLIMGLFTFTYLHLRAWSLRNAVAERLATPGGVEETLRPTLEHYKQAGLLSAKQYVFPADLNVYARVPEPGAHERWIVGNGEQDILVPFEVTPEELTPIVPGMEGAPPGSAGLVVLMNIRWKQRPLTTQETEALPEAPAEVPASPMGPTLPQTQPATSPVAKKVRPKPSVTVDFLNSEFFSMIGANHFNSGRPIVLPESGEGIVQVVLPADALSQLDFSKPLRFYLQIIGQGPGVEYGVDDLPAQIGV